MTDAEREVGQRLVLDLRLEVGECDATVTDMVEDTVDYGEVCKASRSSPSSARTGRSSACAASIADRMLADFPAEYVWVKASKPEPPIPLPVEEVSVEVWRPRAARSDAPFDADTRARRPLGERPLRRAGRPRRWYVGPRAQRRLLAASSCGR